MNERVIVQKPGDINTLEVVREEEPTPGAKEVKVRILAAGVAFGDVLLRRGIGKPTSAFPLTPGYDFVGVVEALGIGSSKFTVGDQVAGFPVTGGQQQFICSLEDNLIPVPKGLSPNDVVSVILNYTTAYQLLNRAANLQPGEAALIHGAAGGVGTAMLQLAKLQGIRLYGTVSPGKMNLVRDLGGVPIDYKNSDFVQEIRRLEPNGVGAVFDAVGGAQLNRSYQALGKNGTLVFFGASSAVQAKGSPTLTLAATMARFALLKLRPDGRRVKFYLIASAKKQHPEHFRQDVQTLLGLLQDDKIKPHIAKVLPLSEVRQAHTLLEGAKVTGKIILAPNSREKDN
jgi:NADPH:quinone reductase-like Zn-dependent oxidoreductase